MESKILTPHPEKLEFLNKDLTKKINESTEDLLKMSNQWSWWYSIRSQSVLKVLHQSQALLFAKYNFLKEEFDACALHYGNLTKKFMSLTSINGDDKMLEIEEQKQQILHLQSIVPFNKTKVQAAEIMQRYAQIKQAMKVSVVEDDPLKKELRTEQIDKLLLHPLWGNLILLVVLFILFQSIFWLASFPMQWIDSLFSVGTTWLSFELL